MFYDMAVVAIISERLQVWSYVPKRFFAVKNENGIACLQEENWHRPMSLNTTFCGHSFVRQCAVTDICYVVICVVMRDVLMLWLWVRYICGRSNLFLSDPRYIQGYDIRAGLELVGRDFRAGGNSWVFELEIFNHSCLVMISSSSEPFDYFDYFRETFHMAQIYFRGLVCGLAMDDFGEKYQLYTQRTPQQL